MRTRLRKLGHGAVVLLPLALAACQTLIKSPEPCGDEGCPKSVCDPKVLTKPTMHAAASDLDHLEKHIDWHGSVAAKVPDVWGQARLTLYREQFEQQMEFELNRFEVSLQGSVARQDQAFALSATALSASLETPVRGFRQQTLPAGEYLRRDDKGNLLDPTDPKNLIVLDKSQTVLIPPTAASNPPGLPPLTGVVRNSDATAGTATDIPFFFGAPGINPANFQSRFAVQDANGKPVQLLVGLEPERYLEQKKRYLDLLAQIRRTNEGDDTADAPGYSLQLFRIPVSILPGKHTDTGHGAEITMTLTPVLGNDLLPTTFRELVANDLIRQLGFPLTQFLNDRETAGKLLTDEVRSAVIALPVFNHLNKLRQEGDQDKIADLVISLKPVELDGFKQIAKLLPDEDRAALLALLAPTTAREQVATEAGYTKKMVSQAAAKEAAVYKGKVATLNLNRQVMTNPNIRAFAIKLPVPSISYSPALVNKSGFPASQLLDVYGLSDCFQIAFAANATLKDSIDRQQYAHLPDVQGFLQQEIAAAHRFLREPECQVLWQQFCTPEMVTAVRNLKLDALQTYRSQYRAIVKDITLSGRRPYNDLSEYSTTAALAWCILVDSALLTDRLKQDMREAATARGKAAPPDVWLPYYLPDPPAEARCAFNEYVRVRWPIHVFALDPAVQEQNLADRLATRRELQLALSLAFSHGFMNFNQLSRYARRLEAEYETIDVNRTQVGFAHGNDTFGWRFYPRYQTPDTPSNLTVIARDLLVGGPNKNQLLRERRLEPGPRECVAMVIMPSFVPAVQLDTTSNFFGLANPKHKVFDHTQAVKLGKTVQAIKTAGGGLTDANCYRDGDAARLVKRAEQLENRLPLQTATFPVPTEGMLGGFELFSTNTTSLSPELYGFYGAPGVSANPGTNPTHLFLVGDHFSPLRTRVIVGNRALVRNNQVPTADTNPPADPKAEAPKAGTVVKNVTLLSRQVMQIEIPPGLLPLYDKEHKRYYYTIHVATPYGVSHELLVPAVDVKAAEAPTPAATEGYKFGADALTLPYCKFGAGKDGKSYQLGLVPVEDKSLKIAWDDALKTAPAAVTNVAFTFDYKGCPLTVVVKDKKGEPIITANKKEAVYTLTAEHLDVLLTDLFSQLNAFGAFTDETNPLAAGLKPTSVTLTPVDEKRAVVKATVSGELTIKFACSICKDGAVVPVAKPGEPKKDEKGKPAVPQTPTPSSSVIPVPLPGSVAPLAPQPNP